MTQMCVVGVGKHSSLQGLVFPLNGGIEGGVTRKSPAELRMNETEKIAVGYRKEIEITYLNLHPVWPMRISGKK